MDEQKLAQGAANAVALLKALGHEQRLMILCALQRGELRVSDLNERVPIPQSSLSQHLAALRQQGLVKTRREAQNIFYRMDSEDAQAVMAVLYERFCNNSGYRP